MTVRAMPLCLVCLRLQAKVGGGGVCTAFPAGIPQGIWLSEIDHRQPYPGDDALTFLPENAAAVRYATLLFPPPPLATLRLRLAELARRIQTPEIQRAWTNVVYDEAQHPRGAHGKFIATVARGSAELSHIRRAIAEHNLAAWRLRRIDQGGNAKQRKAAADTYLHNAEYQGIRGFANIKAHLKTREAALADAMRAYTPAERALLLSAYHHYNDLTWGGRNRQGEVITGREPLFHLKDQQQMTPVAHMLRDHLDVYNKLLRRDHKAAAAAGKAPTLLLSEKARQTAYATLTPSQRQALQVHRTALERMNASNQRHVESARDRAIKEWEQRQANLPLLVGGGDRQALDILREALPPHQSSATTDVHGTQMPFTQGAIDAARTHIEPFDQQGINRTGVAKIDGKRYVIKDMTGVGTLTQQFQQARNEAATVALLHAAGLPEVGPREAYHILGSDGRHYAVISVEPGTGKNWGMQDQYAPLAKANQFSRLILGEYLAGMTDRHAGNVLWDDATRTLREIDFGYGLKEHHLVERSFTLGTWEKQDHEMRFSDAGVRGVLDRRDAILKAADRYPLTSSERDAVQHRLDILEKWYTAHQGDLTMANLQRATTR